MIFEQFALGNFLGHYTAQLRCRSRNSICSIVHASSLRHSPFRLTLAKRQATAFGFGDAHLLAMLCGFGAANDHLVTNIERR